MRDLLDNPHSHTPTLPHSRTPTLPHSHTPTHSHTHTHTLTLTFTLTFTLTHSHNHANTLTQTRTSATTLSQMTQGRFDQLDMHPATKRALAEILRYEFMTIVQQQSCPVGLTGVDILAKAKTGTGKTLSFLIPAVEHIVRAGNSPGIKVLIISPTRELAMQIYEEAMLLVRFHNGVKVMVVVGGTNMNKDKNGFREQPAMLVATPGRLNDHLENSGLDRQLTNMRCMIFDEADQLLDMGFRPAIQQMLARLPPKDTRQTLLFSATMPNDVKAIAQLAMRQQYSFIDTVGAEESTHQHVPQQFLIASKETQM